jgi:ATP-dependent helicase HrpB
MFESSIDKYPVLEVLPQLKEVLSLHPIVILQASPGAGKSTVLPLELLNEAWLANGKIVILEPRRLAARAVATRMASLLDEKPGETIGYRIRFESVVSAKTKIEVVTEGILTRMIQTDNALEGVGLIIFDEFHERSLQADLALALSLQVQQVMRQELRILIMSATLDGEKLSALLNHAPIITSNGRQFPVAYQYLNSDLDKPIASSMARAILRAWRECTGDILAFFPGAGEIAKTQQLIEAELSEASIHGLFGDLPLSKQQEAIIPNAAGQRKIVLATSIAETSLTIEGITVVVDCGYARVPRFDPRSGLTRLETIQVSKDAADQRAGRAGRLGPGICYRLWSEAVNLNLLPNRTPEIMEADLAPLVLELSQWGVKDPVELQWITQPPQGAWNQAIELLTQLDAIGEGRITPRGKQLLLLPTHPRIGHLLLEAGDKKALATDISALLEERDPLPKEVGADLTLRVEALRKWRSGEKVAIEKNRLERIEKLAATWRKILGVSVDNSSPQGHDVGKLLAAAYPERIAKQVDKKSERYKIANGRMAKLPLHDPLIHEPWLSIAQLDAGMGEGKIFLAAPVDPKALVSTAKQIEFIQWDEEREMIVAVSEKRIGSLVLETRSLQNISSEEKVAVLCKVIASEGLRMIGWDEPEREWQARIASVKKWRPEEDWPEVSDEHLLTNIFDWLSPYLTQVNKKADLQKLDLPAILAGILPWSLSSRLDKLVPTKLEVPSGSLIKLQYFTNGQLPIMEVRLQEVFGLTETPTLNEGRTKVLMHLLSPGYKPVQVTQDLKSFWQTTYHDVRKELRMRYPKHSWPEDPWTAQAVRGAKKRGS